MTIDYRQRAIDQMNLIELTGKRKCAVCNKLMAHKKSMDKHINSSHHPEVHNAAQQMEENARMNEDIYYHKVLFTETDRQIAKCEKVIAEQKEKMMTDFSYYFDHLSEPLLLNEAGRHLLIQTKRIIEHQETLEDIYVGLCNFRDSLREEIIEQFPRHNCTNELSNIADRLKMQAKANFVKGRFGGGHLAEMIRYADKLTK